MAATNKKCLSITIETVKYKSSNEKTKFFLTYTCRTTTRTHMKSLMILLDCLQALSIHHKTKLFVLTITELNGVLQN